jgi:hypothetical protein
MMDWLKMHSLSHLQNIRSIIEPKHPYRGDYALSTCIALIGIAITFL